MNTVRFGRLGIAKNAEKIMTSIFEAYQNSQEAVDEALRNYPPKAAILAGEVFIVLGPNLCLSENYSKCYNNTGIYQTCYTIQSTSHRCPNGSSEFQLLAEIDVTCEEVYLRAGVENGYQIGAAQAGQIGRQILLDKVQAYLDENGLQLH